MPIFYFLAHHSFLKLHAAPDMSGWPQYHSSMSVLPYNSEILCIVAYWNYRLTHTHTHTHTLIQTVPYPLPELFIYIQQRLILLLSRKYMVSKHWLF